MALINYILIAVFLAGFFMAGVFVIGQKLKRFDVVDMAWGISFILIAAGTLLYSVVGGSDHSISWAKLVALAAVAIWGTRLALHIGHRIQNTYKEDERYVKLRSKWHGNIEKAIFWRIYMVQAVLATAVSLPVIIINASSTFFVPEFIAVGSIVWVIGFFFESVADMQLEAFLATNKGKLMTGGLWRYSRHPNYFGELMQWWGIGIMALSVPHGWFGLIGPLTLTFLIMFISGIPLLEARGEKREGWGDYKKRTSLLIPLPPKK